MLPNIDPVTSAAAVGATTPSTRRPDMEKALEAYKSAPAARVDEKRVGKEAGRVGSETKEARAPDAVERTSQVKARERTTDVVRRIDDQADIAFQMTREEREVFLGYISGEEEIDQLTDQEKITLERVTERIEKLIEEADARSTKGRGRITLAMKEWYSRLANGKQAPENLIDLIQRAAQGMMDDQL